MMFTNFEAITNSLTSKSQPRGLHNFISDIRNAGGKDLERRRVDDELAKIRSKLTTTSSLTSYDKKKYILKMCYIFLLGYDVDFGHLEFIALLSSTKFSEKAVGYLAIALMVRPGDQIFTLLINSVTNDLSNHSKIHYYIKALALHAVANVGGPELAQTLGHQIQPLIVSPVVRSIPVGGDTNDFNEIQLEFRNQEHLCKKSSLALLSIFKVNNDVIDPNDWVERFSNMLKDLNISVLISLMGLINGVATVYPGPMEALVPHVIGVLQHLVLNRSCDSGHLYYKIPSPWLQVKCLRFLQLYKIPSGNVDVSRVENAPVKSGVDYQGSGTLPILYNILSRIFATTDITDNNNKTNAEHSILFEAINLILIYGNDIHSSLRSQALSALGRFVNIKDANIRYLGLDALIRLAQLSGSTAVQDYQETVLESLKDLDISVRKRALDLVFVMTDRNNAEFVVGELVTNLALAETAMKEDYVVKIAILAEKYPTTWNWYVDTLLRVILVAGDFVAEAVWYRIVQVVINHSDIHTYAAEKMFDTASNKYAHEIGVGLAAYILGEIGENICTHPGKSGFHQFTVLNNHFPRVSTKTQAILLTTYVKLLNLYPDTQDMINDVFNKFSTSTQLELQQRSCEYRVLPKVKGSRDVMESVLDTMPPYPEDKSVESLYALLNKDKEKDKEKKESEGDEEDNGTSTTPKTASNIQAANIPKPVSVTTKVNKEEDLLSLDDSGPSSSQGAIGIPSKITQNMLKQWLRESLLATGIPNQKSILYEDDIIRFTIFGEYRAHQGRLTVLAYNKTGADISNLKLTFPSLPHLTIRVQDPANRIVPAEEGKVLIAVDSLRPFTDYPTFDATFSIGQAPYKYALKLPVLITSFSEPLSTDKETFMNRWKSINGTNTESQEIIFSNKPVNPQTMAFVRNAMFQGLHIGLANGLDNETTATGSLLFRTGTLGPDGNPVSVGAMLRMEGDATQHRFRLTLRANHATVVQGLRAAIKAVIERD